MKNLEIFNELETATVRKDYSGRGMCGKTCTALDVDHPISNAKDYVLRELLEMLEAEITETSDEINNVIEAMYEVLDARTDNMGLGSIIY